MLKQIPFIFLIVSCYGKNDLSEFVEGNRLFTQNLIQIINNHKTGNFMVSPLSAQIILALLQEGANGETLTELKQGLHLPKTEIEIRNAISKIMQQLNTNSQVYDLLTANKIYAAERLEFKTDFMTVAKNTYKIEYENVDFSKKAETAGKINKWVEDQTNDKIKNLIEPKLLSSDTVAVLVNALYMKANWTKQFETTEKQDFQIDENSSFKADMMQQGIFTDYYADQTLGAQFLRLQYETEDDNFLSMTVILPNHIGLEVLENNLHKVFKTDVPFRKTRVSVFLPKFEIETSLDFKTILRELGINKVFDAADLNKMAEGDLTVSDVLQKTFIKVTESGTEAAAATAVVIMEKSLSVDAPEIIFNANHPFLFYISLNEYVLFSGRVLKPSSE